MRCLCYLLLLTVATSCDKPEFPGFSKDKSGIYYMIHEIGDGERKPEKGDIVVILNHLEPYHSNKHWQPMKVEQQDLPILGEDDGDMQEVIRTLVEGDSATFILFRSVNDSIVPMKWIVRLQHLFDSGEFEEELKYRKWRKDQEMAEQSMLLNYVDTLKGEVIKLKEGIFYQEITTGVGDKLKEGEQVNLHYKGYFVNGKVFDSTYDRGAPLDFRYGDPDQVIKGIMLGLRLMRKGGQGKFIIPSQLGYGEAGSSTGIIPPFTTVIYKVEVLNPQKKEV